MLKRVNYFVSQFIPQKVYWHIAGMIHPWEAVLEEENSAEGVYAQSDKLVSLLERLKLISKDSVVLDIGCGVGRLEYSLSTKVKKCIGIDVAPSMVSLARKHVSAKNCQFIVGDGMSLSGIKAGTVDLVFSIIVFQHMPETSFDSYLEESKRVLKKGGALLFQIPVSYGKKVLRPENHAWALRFYTKEELKAKLIKVGFKSVKFLNVEGGKVSGGEDQLFILAK